MTRKKASQSKDAYWEARGQHWTRSRLIAEIRRLHQAGRPLRITKAPVKVIHAGEKLFGSWKAAVEKAGLRYDDLLQLHRWSQEKIVSKIHELAKNGVPLDATSIRKRYSFLFHASKVWFPSSWGNALRAAGFDPTQHKKHRGRWHRQKAAAWVQNRIEMGRSILALDIPSDLKNFAQYHFDNGWCGFVESLGIEYPGKKNRDWTKNLVIQEIRRWASKKQPVHYSAIKRKDSNLLKKAIAFFGSWDAARAVARV